MVTVNKLERYVSLRSPRSPSPCVVVRRVMTTRHKVKVPVSRIPRREEAHDITEPQPFHRDAVHRRQDVGREDPAGEGRRVRHRRHRRSSVLVLDECDPDLARGRGNDSLVPTDRAG